MTATDVYKVASEHFDVVSSGPYGISCGTSSRTLLRIECGSGIAGRGDTWAITFPGHPEMKPICGLRTKAQLTRELRKVILDRLLDLVAPG